MLRMGLTEENKAIEVNMRSHAKQLLENKEVDVILGYGKGTLPLTATPMIISSVDKVDGLVWNNLCYMNLAKYLAPRVPILLNSDGTEKKVGVVCKGCVARAILLLSNEKQIKLDNIKIIGIDCNGNVNRSKIHKEIGEKEILEVIMNDSDIIVKGKGFEQNFPYDEYKNELCKTCKITKPPINSDLCVGDCKEVESVHDDFKDIIEYKSKAAAEKWDYIRDTLETCTRCYACREACPMCYCNLCFVDQNKPVWFNKTTDFNDIMVFHLIRAFHMAGRCIGCGACSSVCPMGIDLNLINRALEEMAKRRFDYTSGLSADVMPPMMNFDMEDKQEFMLEED